MSMHPFSRRGFLFTSGTLMAWAFMPKILSAAPARDPRFVAIVLRGALDGLATVAPVGDPDYVRVRNGLVLTGDGERGGFDLDGFFVLNSNMPRLAELYRRGEALIVHAAATPYRDRSHFDGQDVLESGEGGPGVTDSGWLNRALLALPQGEPIARRETLALGAQIPLIVRGEAPVVTLLPPGIEAASDDTRMRILDLYEHTDPALAARFADAMKLRARLGMSGDDLAGASEGRRFRYAGETAGKLLSRDDGPRVGAISLNGWDTHQEEGPIDGRLGRLLSALDGAIDGLRTSLGPAWKETVVTVVTEFGRTAAMNGTDGTDHGTATVMLVVGGAVKGGRVLADWPGLSPHALYEGRDLMPTTDVRAVLKGMLRDHLGVPEGALAGTVFPDSETARPVGGLVL